MNPSRRQLLASAAAAAIATGCADRTARRPASASGNPSQLPDGPSPSQTRGPRDRGPAIEISHGPRSGRDLALTFHTAGDPSIVDAVLNAARAADAKLTMLVVGTWLAENPHFARRILTDGHDLGNHTWSHPTLSDDNRVETRDEIARCRRLLTRLTGNAGTWFRPSGTQFATTLMLHEAGAAGYRVSLSYDVDPLDYTNPGSAVVTQRVLHEAKAGSIVSLHTLYAGTADAMPGLLSGLQDAGLRPVAASRLLRRSIT